ncbi:hypothetical protein PZ895_17730 [Mesorhizobium sp. YIM 152430]|uniref:hypothetical protein n=1 Tax=Mesorhizobium sp. YIM 152430 TaxID=3031761 RepID=UPI0023DAF2BB|nr:hypothetical protein [Mesorhizobium sp. YIM 152430]MDF1601599.1 hypothetical protein [Mesorhizobium sp. YIM 152430]
MSTRRVKSSSETTSARPAPSSMSAETIAAGTTAGALMLGVVQAEAARKDAALETAASAVDAGDPLSALLATGDIMMDEAASRDLSLPPAGADDAPVPTPAGDVPDRTTPPDPQPVERAMTAPREEPPSEPVATDAPAAADIEAIASRISDQVVSAIGQVAEGLHADGFAAGLAQSIAAEIADTAVSIARDLNAASTVETELARIGDLVPTVETIADGLKPLLDPSGTASGKLFELPSDVLGAEIVNDLGGGLLSELFYSDGGSSDGFSAADALTASIAPLPSGLPGEPDLSEAAFSFVEGAAAPAVDLIGLSYIDAPDLPYSGMQSSLGALHVI